MSAAQSPKDETLRLEKLRALKLLDTASEERFDRLTRMAKRLFLVDTAVVSLVDEDRQWFKSKASDQPLPDETPRDISFCGHAILGSDVFVIEDALADERFKDNPLVTEKPGIRFYAGFPLRINDGSALGTLCIFDSEPRAFGEEDVQLLRDLGHMAEKEVAALQLVTLDPLTLISNRRGFMELAQYAFSVSKRKKLPAAVILFDINRFKVISQEFGQSEADQVLVKIASIVNRVFRETDIFGRVGDDEFAVFMMESDDDSTRDAIRRLERAVEKYDMEKERGYNIEFSAGYVVASPGTIQTLEDLFALADERMHTV